MSSPQAALHGPPDVLGQGARAATPGEPFGRDTERGGVPLDGRDRGIRPLPAHQRTSVSGVFLAGETVEIREPNPGNREQVGEPSGERVKSFHRAHEQRTLPTAPQVVKNERSEAREVRKTTGMAAKAKREGEGSPIADRIRAEIKARGTVVTAFSQAIGWEAGQLGMILRRLDAGGNLRSDTAEYLAAKLEHSVHWLFTGEEPGPALSTLPGWAEARAGASGRVSEEALDVVGAWRVAKPPSQISVAFVLALARAYEDTRS